MDVAVWVSSYLLVGRNGASRCPLTADIGQRWAHVSEGPFADLCGAARATAHEVAFMRLQAVPELLYARHARDPTMSSAERQFIETANRVWRPMAR